MCAGRCAFSRPHASAGALEVVFDAARERHAVDIAGIATCEGGRTVKPGKSTEARRASASADSAWTPAGGRDERFAPGMGVAPRADAGAVGTQPR